MYKRILGCVREYKAATILSIVFIVMEVAMETILPFVMSKMINLLTDSSTTDVMALVWKYAGILIAMAILSLVSGVLSGVFAAKASAGLAKNVRKDLYDSISRFSFSNIDKFSSSSLVTRMTTDVTNVQTAYMMVIRTAIRSPMMLIFSVIMAFVISPSLAWIFIVVLPILFVLLIIIVRHSMPSFKKVFKKYDALNESVQENISGIRTVKSYVREDHEIKKFNRAATSLRDNFIKAEKVVALNGPLMSLAIYTVNVVVIILGAKVIIVDGALTVGGLSSLIVYGIQSLMSLMMISMLIVMFTLSIESVRRIDEVLKEVPSLKNPSNPVYDVKDGSIEFKNVSFKYSKEAEKFALENINLKIKSGQTVGILGSTGSSKTTLVNLISRLYDVSEGEVLVGGLNVKDYDIESLRNQVSVVLQKNLLFKGTIKDNLRWGKEDATDEEIIKACKDACADEFIETLPKQYDYMIEQGGNNVSGGQKQRLCIARALLKKPKILILDDSTSAVDTKTDAKIRKAFKTAIPNTTKIIIAQRISSIQDADLIICMDNGTINGMGTHDELIKSNEIYQEVYYSQNKLTSSKGGK